MTVNSIIAEVIIMTDRFSWNISKMHSQPSYRGYRIAVRHWDILYGRIPRLPHVTDRQHAKCQRFKHYFVR